MDPAIRKLEFPGPDLEDLLDGEHPPELGVPMEVHVVHITGLEVLDVLLLSQLENSSQISTSHSLHIMFYKTYHAS